MAIIQISKLQHRSGNLVDLPQLSDAEFGWATDSKRLFIGKASPNENIEVLTSYSNVNFSQIVGSVGNLSITSPVTGQVLSYNGNTWINSGGNATDPGNSTYFSDTNVHLGNISNVKIGGGAIGYVLETDGIGNLSWSPKGSLYTPIVAVSNATPIIMTVDNTVPYVNGTAITISSVAGINANTIVNGKTFYITLAVDYAATGNVELYTAAARTAPDAAVGTGLVATGNTGVATSVLSTGSGGSSYASGSNTTIQFNKNNLLEGNTGFTYDYIGKLMSLTGNANVGNLNATGVATATRFLSNIATGTTPIQVVSTTLVPNLYVARANVADNSVITAQTTGTFYPTFVSGSTTGNYAHGSNANLSFNAANGALSATLLTGTLTTAAQPNITSVGTLISLAVTGNISGANLTGTHYGAATGLTAIPGGNVTGTVANATYAVNAGTSVIAGTVTTAAQPNITSVGTLSALAVTGNISGANLTGTHYGAATGLTAIPGGNVTGTVANATYAVTAGTANAVAGANVSGAVAFATTANAVAGANVSGQVTFAATANAVAGANVSGAVAFATTANAVAGANVSGQVTFAATANAVAGANVSGTVGSATVAASANAVAGANVSGQVTFAATANAVAGANVSGQVANALVSGTVYTAAQPNITSVGTLSSLSVSANTTTGGIKTDNYYYANGVTISFLGAYSNANVALYLPTFTGTVGATAITSGANTTAGAITGNWTLTAGSRLNATYADLAECYEADADYAPGTVLEFGGTKEVTLASDSTNRVAGVVSTNPAYLMNSLCPGVYIAAIALQGRAPCKIRGTIRKGDMLVSGGDGFARPSASPLMGTVIGKALSDFDGVTGIIECAVGRL